MAINICSSSTALHTISLASLQPKSHLKPTHFSSSTKICFDLSSDNIVLAPETMPFSELNSLEKKLGGNELERDWKNGLGVRRKRRRKRRNFEIGKDLCGDIKHISFRCKRDGQHLSPKEEAEYTLLIKEEARLEAVRRQILETSKHEPTSTQWAEAVGLQTTSLDRILCGGRESRERITQSYKRLVVSIASVYQGRGLNLQDLVQEGSIGLLIGAKKFDPERGYKLSTYVYWWIRQAVSKAITNKSRTIRLPGNVCELIPKIAETNNILAVRLRRLPSYEEIAEHVGAPITTVRVVCLSSRDPISLDQAMTSHGCMNLQDIMPGPEEMTPEAMLIKLQRKQQLEKLLTELDDREARILRLHYGLNGETPRSFDEIGKLLKLSRERIRQINGIALSKLKQNNKIDDMKVYIET